MSEMVERVARAIAVDALRQNPMLEIMDGGLGYYDDYDNKAYDCVEIARAAIEAMRLPTEAMTEAGAMQSGGATKEQAIEWAKLDKFESRQMEAEDIFIAMIDAALIPSPPEN